MSTQDVVDGYVTQINMDDFDWIREVEEDKIKVGSVFYLKTNPVEYWVNITEVTNGVAYYYLIEKHPTDGEVKNKGFWDIESLRECLVIGDWTYQG